MLIEKGDQRVGQLREGGPESGRIRPGIVRLSVQHAGDERLFLLVETAHHAQVEFALAASVVVDGGDIQPDGVGDLAGGYRMVAVFGEEQRRRLDDALVALVWFLCPLRLL